MQKRNSANRLAGAWFEKVFAYHATRQGFLCVHNGTQCRFLGQGKILPIKSNLDWTLIHPSGRVLFIDTKSFEKDRFSRSQLSAAQLQRARNYERHCVSAGFVVYLRGARQVAWFAAHTIDEKGPRASFTAQDGALLGGIAGFDLRLISSLRG